MICRVDGNRMGFLQYAGQMTRTVNFLLDEYPITLRLTLNA